MRRIAVLMPVYNEENFIRQSLYGIVRQSIKPSLVLIGDNESTDNTTLIAKRILDKSGIDYRIIRVKRYPELGKLNINNVYHALTKHLYEQSAEVDFVATIEADVILEKRYFEKMLKLFEKDEKLCISGGSFKPQGLPKDPFPLINVNVNLWGCNRVYRAKCWFELNEAVDIRQLPAWDTDHVLLTLLLKYHVYPASNAISFTLRDVNPFGGKPKGLTDALHGLPFWWALFKMLQYQDLEYLINYLVVSLSVSKRQSKQNEFLKKIKEIYQYGSYYVLKNKLLSMIFGIRNDRRNTKTH